MNKLILLLLLFLGPKNYATIHQVGLEKKFKSPNALYLANIVKDGDTIEIDPEIYSGIQALAIWKSSNLLIKGVKGRPHLSANGKAIAGKGIWVISGNNITVENIEFSGTTVVDKNGAGIRFEGIDLIVRNCYFHDNDDGILISNPYKGDVLIEYTEFSHNGFGDGYSHNLYCGHVNKLTFRYNYSHNASKGHNLKSRANENYILYNRIMDEATGTSSRVIDIPNGGFAIIMGNSLMQGKNAENPNLLGYGLEGLSNEGPNEAYIINNTFVNKKLEQPIFIDVNEETSVVNISNNIFAGLGTITNNDASIQNNNLIETDIKKILFVDEQNYNYHLQKNSPAINFGKEMESLKNYGLSPNASYDHPTKKASRNSRGNKIDVGAFEYN